MCPCADNLASEAYLEGMKTNLGNLLQKCFGGVRSLPRRNENRPSQESLSDRTFNVRSLPRRNENAMMPVSSVSLRVASEAYLEGMKTRGLGMRIVRDRPVSEAYLEGMKT